MICSNAVFVHAPYDCAIVPITSYGSRLQYHSVRVWRNASEPKIDRPTRAPASGDKLIGRVTSVVRDDDLHTTTKRFTAPLNDVYLGGPSTSLCGVVRYDVF